MDDRSNTADVGLDFRTVFEATPNPYLLLRPDAPAFSIAAVNDAYLQATGTSRDAILGRGLFEVFPDNVDDPAASGVSDLRASLECVLRERAPDVMGVQKYDIPLRDGSDGFEVRYWSPINSPVIGRDGEVTFVIHRVEDVTEFILTREKALEESAERIASVRDRADRAQAEVLKAGVDLKEANRQLKMAGEQLAEANIRLTSLDRAKTEFFSNISHEFRTPLTLMLGPLEELVEADQDQLSDEAREQARTALRNARRLLKLVNNLLDFSRLEAGDRAATFAPTDIAELTADLAAAFRSACERAGLALTVDCPPLRRPVYVDRSMWEKVVLNLLSNAFKFTHAGGINVALGESPDGKEVELRVSDTGVGVPPDQLPRLFERFHRVEGARGRTFEGSGIGLSLVQELVHLHGGQVTVESELGRGSTFTVTTPFGAEHLPAGQVEAHVAEAAFVDREAFFEEALFLTSVSEAPSAPSADDRAGRVVLADDNADMRAYVGRLLRATGRQVDEVSDGAQALDQIRQAPPDLVIADVMMPELDGLALLRMLREDPRTASTPVILLSAKAGEEAKVGGWQAGADDYLVKPFSARELVARVDGVLRLSRLRRDLEEQLRQAQKMEAVGKLTGGVAHDFNNLLTPIIGGLDVALGRIEDERARRYVSTAITAAQRGAKLASQLLAFSHNRQLQVRDVDVGLLVDGLSDLLLRSAGSLVELKIAIDPQARAVLADPDQLELALLNLVLNARDAMPDGGSVTVFTAPAQLAADAVLPSGDYVAVGVHDTGEGMSPEVAARAFEPFYSTKEVGKGSGLGLSQVYATAQKCGGVARIETAPGAGTTISMLFRPGQVIKEAAAPPPAPSAPAATRRSLGAKILVIDDDDAVRELFVEGLQAFGYRVAEARDGRVGLDLLDREWPDALLIDYAMPEMTGGEVARRARERRPGIPIVFATGFANADELANFPECRVLRKPLTVPEVANAMEAALSIQAPSGQGAP